MLKRITEHFIYKLESVWAIVNDAIAEFQVVDNNFSITEASILRTYFFRSNKVELEYNAKYLKINMNIFLFQEFETFTLQKIIKHQKKSMMLKIKIF